MTPFQDPEFNRQQSDADARAVRGAACASCPTRDFVELLRSAIKEDEWMLYAHGAVLGFGAGSCTWRSSASDEMTRRATADGARPARDGSSRWRGSAPAPGGGPRAGAWTTSLQVGRRRLLGLVDRDGQGRRRGLELLGARGSAREARAEPPTLRERGELLLHASADVDYEQGSHPAYDADPRRPRAGRGADPAPDRAAGARSRRWTCGPASPTSPARGSSPRATR